MAKEKTTEEIIDSLNEQLKELQEKHTALETSSTTEVENLSGQLAQLQEKHDALTADHANLQEKQTALTTDHAELQEKHAELESSSADEVEKLSNQLAQATKAAAQGYVSITVDGKNYKVMGKNFRINNTDVKVEDLLKDDETVKKLIGMGSGIFVELTD